MTDTQPKIYCPKCQTTEFEVSAHPTTIEEFVGAICQNCGATITEDDIKAQAMKIAEKEMRKFFHGSRTININL